MNYQVGGLIWEIVIIAVCVYIARSKGRSPVVWGILGLLFSLITLIVLLIIPSKNPAQHR